MDEISENVLSADNQQERLITIGWVTGFVDGEGCFSVGFIKQPDRAKRKGYALGVQVWCEFRVTQGEKSLDALKKLQHFFGLGSIYRNARSDNHTEDLHNFTVRNRDELREIIIPFFQIYPLQTAKRQDFEKFVQCFRLIENKDHLTPEGLQEIARICSLMNRRKDRTSIVERILNDQTRGALERV
jgi:hypothetical protein